MSHGETVMRRSYLLIVIGVLTLPAFFAGCSPAPDFWGEAKEGQKRILVTFPPLYAITQHVAGEEAYVLCLLTNEGPHEYQATQTDVLKVNKADLLIYNGLTLDDPIVSKMMKDHRNTGSLRTLNVGEVMVKEHHNLVLHPEHDHAHDKEHKGHDHGEHDPHMWLGPDRAIMMTKIIARKLGDIDTKKKANYDKRAEAFVDQLRKVKEYGKEQVAKKKNKKIVTMHDAFGYFAEEFDVEIVGSIQTKPGMDPDSVTMAKLVELCRAKDVRVIAVEPQYSKGQAESLQKSLKGRGLEVTIVTLDPLETAPVADKKLNPDPGYYLAKMRENIDTLVKALP
jgi:zinc transport system substrate-binding protein